MSFAIQVYNRYSNEYAKLSTAAALLNTFSPAKFKFTIEDIYFDFGQDWEWTTIICYKGSNWGGFQALCPAEQEKILLAGDPVELAEIVNTVLEHCIFGGT